IGQPCTRAPVRGRPPSREKAGFGQNERPRADGAQPPDQLRLPPKPAQQRRMRAVTLHTHSTRYQKGIDPALDFIEAMIGVQAQPRRSAEGAARDAEDFDPVRVVGSVTVILEPTGSA